MCVGLMGVLRSFVTYTRVCVSPPRILPFIATSRSFSTAGRVPCGSCAIYPSRFGDDLSPHVFNMEAACSVEPLFVRHTQGPTPTAVASLFGGNITCWCSIGQVHAKNVYCAVTTAVV